MAKQPRAGLGLLDRLVLLVAWIVTCGLVYVLGFYVGKGTQENRLGLEERVVRLPVTSKPPPAGQRPQTDSDLTFYDTLGSGEHDEARSEHGSAHAPKGAAPTRLPAQAEGPPSTVPAGGGAPAHAAVTTAPARTTHPPAAAAAPTHPAASAVPAEPAPHPALAVVPATRPGGGTASAPRPSTPAVAAAAAPATSLPASAPSPHPGSAPVRLPAEASARAVIPPAAPLAAPARPATGGFTVLANPTRSRDQAEALYRQLRGRGYDATVVRVLRDGETWYRVQVGRFSTSEQANETMLRLREHEGVAHVFVASE
jgi:cell division septation protein DedD